MPPLDEALVLVPLAKRGRIRLSGVGGAADGLFRGIVGGRSAREIARLRGSGLKVTSHAPGPEEPRGDGLERDGRQPAGRRGAHGAADDGGLVGAGGQGHVRIYIPTTVAGLQRLLADEQIQPLSGTAFALTPALREEYVAGDEEELEYAAMSEAARASLRLLATELGSDPDTAPRRAVVAADVDDVTLRPDLDAAVVRVKGPIPMRALAAIHLDVAEAGEAVRRAAEVIDAADLGDEDAELAVGDAEDHDLAWYGVQELPFVLAARGPHPVGTRPRNAAPARSPSAIRPCRKAGDRSPADAESSWRPSSIRSMPTSR